MRSRAWLRFSAPRRSARRANRVRAPVPRDAGQTARPAHNPRTMSRHTQNGRNAPEKEVREAERVLSLGPVQQRHHPSAVAADHSELSHINTYGNLPDVYLDRPFVCRKCGKTEIWKARDQKWYYEEAKGHIDARAVECHDCRTAKKKVRGVDGAA